MPAQTIAIMGAGAVGCYLGAMLAEGGNAVTLIGRPALAAAVDAGGLTLEMAGATHRVQVTAATEAEAVAGAGLVLLTVKAGDLREAARSIAPHLAPDATVVCLQNGIGHAERVAAVIGRPVLSGVVYAAVAMAGPAHVRHSGGGSLILADGAGAADVAARFPASRIAVEITSAIDPVLWTKLTVNCVYNALSAISRLPYGRILTQPGAEQTMRDVMDECVAVAAAEGITLPADLWATVRAVADAMPAQYSSTAQDLMRGRGTEIDHLNGEIVRLGAAAQVPVPVNRALWLLVKLAEAQGGADGTA